MFRVFSIFILTLVTLANVQSRITIPKPARELSRFETNWLTAHLNGDQNWLSRFSAGKLNVVPPGSGRFIEERSEAVAAATVTKLRADEMKVRISGTISLLTNDPAQNRSFYFLDTFNKIGGRWRVIASSISPSAVSETTSPEQIEGELLQLENQLARSGTFSGPSGIDRFLAPDFVGTSANGAVQNRQEWIHGREPGRLGSSLKSEMQVRILADDLAVVTGIDTLIGSELSRKANRVRFTNTWAKRGVSWQCVASHVSIIA